jgi:hypothetical protein
VLAAAASAAQAQSTAPDIAARMRADLGVDARAVRAALLDEGEALLAAGRPEDALRVLQQAGQMLHSPDTELAMVRAMVQASAYRQALTFAAHAAGAHRNLPGGMALYAWLLHVGGQAAHARWQLGQALGRAPDEPALRDARDQLAAAWPQPTPVLLQRPWRTAPYSTPVDAAAEPAPADLRVVGSATLAGAGDRVLAPTRALQGEQRPWVRNGLGQTAAATLERELPGLGLSLLRLERALPMPAIEPVARPPFAGSPGAMLEFAPSQTGTAAWPLMRVGFFGRSSGTGSPAELGIDVPEGPRGGPVFDGHGRLAGVALADPAAGNILLPWALVRTGLGLEAEPVAAPPAAPGARVGEDEIYERGLKLTLQLLVER